MQSTGNKDFNAASLFNVEGWSVVVTGGGTGIGLMIAQAFANNGARVYITGRRADVLENTAKTWGSKLEHPKGQLIPITADITDKDSIEKLVKEVSSKEKKLDVLINNAGVSLGTSAVEKGQESAEALKEELWKEKWEDWEQIFKTNVIGYFFTSVAFLPLLAAANRPDHTACIINISSISRILKTTQHHFNYNSSKAATIQLNNLLAQEFSQPGVKVRVNSIAPGIFPSQMTAGDKDEQNKSQIETGNDYGEKKGIPANRPGAETDMAQTALYVAWNQYLYGQTIAVDGGYLLKNP